jgi:hypothetical protein
MPRKRYPHGPGMHENRGPTTSSRSYLWLVNSLVKAVLLSFFTVHIFQRALLVDVVIILVGCPPLVILE